MSLGPGTRLGPYEIVAPIGAGGMGEVYKARDTRLDRTVAVKVLPAHVSDDPALRERFEREARTIGALNHPHICTLHDVGHQDGIDFLVLEHLEGQTLVERLTKGALPIDQALQIAIPIADALDKAHRAGIVHRDLKPGNIMLTKSGAKLLDFGLAKVTPAAVAASGLSIAPTGVTPVTMQGTILGTLQYMAPEQVEGHEADARSDIFALGVVLYEMLTGRKAFEGKSQATLIAAIVGNEPPAISTLQPLAPPMLDDVVRMCLAKDPSARWQSAADVWRTLSFASKYRPAAEPHVVPSAIRSWRIAWAIAALCVVALASGSVWLRFERTVSSPRDLVRFQFAIPNTGFYRVAVSPLGRSVAYVAAGSGGTALWVRALDSDDVREVPVGGQPGEIAWSPDDRLVAFASEGKLRTLDVASGTVQTLCEVPGAVIGIAWTTDSAVVFGVDGSSETSGLFRIPAAGGSAQRFAALPTGALKSLTFDSRNNLAIDLVERSAGRQLCVTSLSGRELGCLPLQTDTVAYAGSGYLVFSRGSTSVAQRFDTRGVRLDGDAAPVAANVGGLARKAFAVAGGSAVPVLAYIAARTGANSQFTWFDRTGRTLASVGEPSSFVNFDLSPDARFVAATRRESSGYTAWILDARRAIVSRAETNQSGADVIWAPDGSGFAYLTQEPGGTVIYEQPAFGGAPKVLVRRTDVFGGLEDWSKDGRFIALETQGGHRGEAQPVDGGKPLILTSGTTAVVDEFRFSPDGKWVAYNSDESGRQEVYVAPFPATGSRWQVSAAGGVQPRWRGDGHELFYLTPDGTLTAAAIGSGTPPDIGKPASLFKTGVAPTYNLDHFAVTTDGQRFLIRAPVSGQDESLLKIVVNWDAPLKP